MSASSTLDYCAVFEAAPSNCLLLDRQLRILAVSDAYARVTMTERDAICGRHIFDVFPDNPDDRTANGVRNLRASLERVLARRETDVMPVQKYDIRRPPEKGGGFEVRYWAPKNVPVLGPDGDVELIVHGVVDVTTIESLSADARVADRVADLLRAQKRALELMVDGEPLGDVLAHLVRVVEELSNGRAVASILLLDDQMRLRNGASPSLPGHYVSAIDGIRADSDVGTCAAAAATGTVILTPDFATDRRWETLRHLPLGIGFQGAWSQPIKSREGRVLGTFGTYFRERREPTPEERESVEILASTAALAIERDRAEVQRLASEQALRDTDRRKDEFLAMLAHELRNPLAPLSTALQILTQRSHGTLDPLHQMMDRQVAHLVRLVDDLMEVSRVTRGKIELRRERVTLARAIQDAIETSRPLLDAAGHALHVAASAEPLVVDADPVRLTQIFSNLLNNAARYTPKGGRIDVSWRRDDDHAEISVKDSGTGIDPASIDRVFELFVQAPARGASVSGGLGIGLTLVRELTRLHGGTVRAESAGSDRGAEFIVRLPLADAPRGEIAKPHGRGAPVGHRVLVVDDNVDAAEMLSLYLSELGADVEVAFDGTSALAVEERFCPNVILLDLGMPGLDGFDVARQVRARRSSPVVLVAVTGWSDERTRARARECGFDHYLPKPLELDALRGVLDGARG